MKPLPTLILSLIVSVGIGQTKPVKWKYAGYSVGYIGGIPDTTEVYYVLPGKDTTMQELQKEACKCAVFSTFDQLTGVIYMPCDHLIKQHYITNYYYWRKTQLRYKGKIIKTNKPEWYSNAGTFSTDDYEYYYAGKKVYPIELFKQPIIH